MTQSAHRFPRTPIPHDPQLTLLYDHTRTSVSSTMIPVVILPSSVVLVTTDGSGPANVPLPPIIPILTAELTTAAVTSISPQHAKGNPSRHCKFYMQRHCQYGRRGQICLTNMPLCCSNSYVMEPEGVINWIALIPTQIYAKRL